MHLGTTIATIIDRSPDRSAAEKSTAKYAYVTLLSGIDKSLRYRGFLYNALIIKRALNQLGSTADFITLIGYRYSISATFKIEFLLIYRILYVYCNFF